MKKISIFKIVLVALAFVLILGWYIKLNNPALTPNAELCESFKEYARLSVFSREEMQYEFSEALSTLITEKVTEIGSPALEALITRIAILAYDIPNDEQYIKAMTAYPDAIYHECIHGGHDRDWNYSLYSFNPFKSK
jgi:hypothetical protein